MKLEALPMHGSSLVIFAWMLVGSACGGTRPAQGTTPSKTTVVEMDEVRISAARGHEGYQFESYDAAELFDQATDLLNHQRCPAAVELYDKVVAEFSTSRYASAAAYNAGLCLQATGDFAGAAQRYARVRDDYPGSSDRRDASFQLAEVLVQLERWADVLQIADELLALGDLSGAERLEGMARRSQALLGLKQLDQAESYARGAIAFARARPESDPIRDEFFSAACAYVVAETYRERQQAVPFPADAEGQKTALLRRAELVLRAQQEYLVVIGFQNLSNYHWAAAAGYRIGSMYEGLWQAMTQAPIPATVAASARPHYHAELAKLIRPLIRNAVRYWEATQLSIERSGIKTAWAARIEGDLQRVRALLLEDTPGPAAEPPSGSNRPPDTAPPSKAAPRRTPSRVSRPQDSN
jgi:hypothetical protein